MPVFKVTVNQKRREIVLSYSEAAFHIEATSIEEAKKAAGLIISGDFNQDIDDVVGGEWEEVDSEGVDGETIDETIESVEEAVGNLIEPDVIAEEVIKYSEEHS